jgi:peptidylprolyl isomerase
MVVVLFTAGCTDNENPLAPLTPSTQEDEAILEQAQEVPVTVTTKAPVTVAIAPVDSGVSAPGDYVEVDYTGTLSDGEVFDSSIGFQPLGFVVASGVMIPGFDEAVQGMSIGEVKTVTLTSAEAYGDWTEDMIIEIPRNIESEEEPPVVGEMIYLFGGAGFVPVTVLELSDETITVDANHPLAGEDLTFEITMVKIVKPTDPEHPNNSTDSDLNASTQEFIIEIPELAE